MNEEETEVRKLKEELMDAYQPIMKTMNKIKKMGYDAQCNIGVDAVGEMTITNFMIYKIFNV